MAKAVRLGYAGPVMKLAGWLFRFALARILVRDPVSFLPLMCMEG